MKNSPGFVVYRILLPMLNEAFFVLAEDVVDPTHIDDAMKLGGNQPIGRSRWPTSSGSMSSSR